MSDTFSHVYVSTVEPETVVDTPISTSLLPLIENSLRDADDPLKDLMVTVMLVIVSSKTGDTRYPFWLLLSSSAFPSSVHNAPLVIDHETTPL